MIEAELAYHTRYKRLEGLTDGRFEEGWVGEWFMLLGAVWGAGGALGG